MSTPSPLFAALRRADARAALALIEKKPEWGTKVYTKNTDGYTPLHVVCERPGRWAASEARALVACLLKAGALIDAPASPSQEWNTPLMVAAREGGAVLVGALLDAGANPNALSLKHRCAADLVAGACESGAYGSTRTRQVLLRLLAASRSSLSQLTPMRWTAVHTALQEVFSIEDGTLTSRRRGMLLLQDLAEAGACFRVFYDGFVETSPLGYALKHCVNAPAFAGPAVALLLRTGLPLDECTLALQMVLNDLSESRGTAPPSKWKPPPGVGAAVAQVLIAHPSLLYQRLWMVTDITVLEQIQDLGMGNILPDVLGATELDATLGKPVPAPRVARARM